MTDVQDKINALWNGAAGEYDERPRHGVLDPREEQAWSDALRRLLPEPPSDVLDVGTGTGTLALLIAKLGYRVRGVDLAENMLLAARRKAAEQKLDVTFEAGNAMNPRGEPGSVDVIVNRHVFWTLTEPETALRNWLRLLRPGGRIVIIDGLWFANNASSQAHEDEEEKEPEDDPMREISPHLPVIKLTTLGDIQALVGRAGFVDVATSGLEDIGRIERELHGPSEDLERYVLTARKK